MRKLLAAAAATLVAGAAGGGAWAAPCAHTCTTPQVNIVYFGATAPNQAVNIAMTNLYGDPVNTCSSVIKVYQCAQDLDNNGTFETCVRAFVGDNKGSCEGVGAMDNKQSNFNICDPNAAGAPNSGSAGLKSASLLNDEDGHPLYANYSGADVSYTLCEPVETNGTILRPDVFANTETQVFVNPFVAIANRNIEGALNARAKTAGGAACPYASNDCYKLDLNLTAQKGQSIFGSNNLCDWRTLSKDIDPSTFRNIGTVLRNRLSGTRRLFNVQVLANQAVGLGNVYIAGSGGLVTEVNGNLWCGNDSANCGENQSTGQVGIGSVSAACTGTNANTTDLGILGVDRLITIDPGTPADPHDDWSARNNGTDSYDPIKYEGTDFNKANVRCGRYQWWSIERNYYDNDSNVAINGRQGYYFPDSGTKATAVKALINQLTIDAASDPTLVPLGDMYVTKAKDGAPLFPNKPYNSFCNEP